MNIIKVTTSKSGEVATFTPLCDGNVVLPCHGVTCYGAAQIARAGEYLDAELRKIGRSVSEFAFGTGK